MPAVRGKKVLIFGDSLSSGSISPGGVLGRELSAAGATVKINAKVGRSAWNFYGREDHAAQLAAIRAWEPDLVIVMLGTNDIGLSLDADRDKMFDLRNSLAHGGDTEVWGIGPPSFASKERQEGADAVTAMMRPIFSGDGFIDWRALSHDQTTTGRTSDQVHFTAAGAEVAGKRLAKQFLEAGGGIGWIAVVAIGALAWAILR